MTSTAFVQKFRNEFLHVFEILDHNLAFPGRIGRQTSSPSS